MIFERVGDEDRRARWGVQDGRGRKARWQGGGGSRARWQSRKRMVGVGVPDGGSQGPDQVGRGS